MNSYTEQLNNLRSDAIFTVVTKVKAGVTYVDGLGSAFPQRTPLTLEGDYVKFNGMPVGIIQTHILARAADLLNGILS